MRTPSATVAMFCQSRASHAAEHLWLTCDVDSHYQKGPGATEEVDVAALGQVVARLDLLERALLTYARHGPNCGRSQFLAELELSTATLSTSTIPECDCGLQWLVDRGATGSPKATPSSRPAALLLADEVTCPKCGQHRDFTWVEDATITRNLIGYRDGRIFIESYYGTDDEGSDNGRLVCSACLVECDLPPGVEPDWR